MLETFAFIIICIGLIGMTWITLSKSDQTHLFRLITIFTYIPMLILEIFHLFFPDPTNLIDIGVHIVSGLAIYLTACNLKFLDKKNRIWIGIIIVIIVITITEIIVNPLTITIDSYEDFLFTVFGGCLGIPLYYLSNLIQDKCSIKFICKA